MDPIRYYPVNAPHVQSLMEFNRKVAAASQELGFTPVIHGSLAYFIHTRDSTMPVNDIDYLIPEKQFEEIQRHLEARGLTIEPVPQWKSIHAHDGELLVELDSIEHYYYGRKLVDNFIDVDFNGQNIRIVSLGALRKLYKIASEISSSGNEAYRAKWEKLDKLK